MFARHRWRTIGGVTETQAIGRYARSSMMVRKILTGVDDQPAGRDAAALASALAAAQDADLLLVGVYPDPLLPFPLRLRGDAHLGQAAEQLLLDVRRDCAPNGRTCTVADISPARALRHLAEREHAGLLVLGSSRRAVGGEVRGGHVARQVLHGAPCPVAIAARGRAQQPSPLRRIVAGIDGSPESDAALALAAALASASHAELEIVAVADDALPTMITPVGGPVVLMQWEEVVAQQRTHAERLVHDAKVAVGDVMGLVRVGNPAVELAEAAEGADLLVLGSRHWGRFGRIYVGSVGEELLRSAPCSLLFVPRPAEVDAKRREAGTAAAAPAA
jgi:nucleotide-binding universal stress UspA family protein